tara:strand:- start:666 stop:4070 length:3405 start_codon:yes stop_codon:yes gene_type:complete
MAQENQLDYFIGDNLSSNDTTIKSIKSSLPQSTLTDNYSLTQLQDDPEFSFRANRFLKQIGRNENIVEYLRDGDYSLSSAISRTQEIGDWNKVAQEDYVYLRDKYSKANLKGAREWAGFAKDMAVDVVADPLNVVTALFAIPSMGTSLAARTAAGEVARQGLKKYTASQLTNVAAKAAKKPAIFGAAEGSAWNGAHNYFVQNQDIKLDIQPDMDWKQVGVSGIVGGLAGGVLGGALGAFGGYRYLNKMMKYADEQDITRMNKKTALEIVDDYEIDEAFTPQKAEDLNTTQSFLDKAVGGLFGKSTTQFKQQAKSSETLTKLLKLFRYDFGTSVFGKDAQKVLQKSYGEAKGRRVGYYLARLDRSLNKLYRRGWSGKLDEEDDLALKYYLRDPRAKKYINAQNEKVVIPERIRIAGKEIVELNNKLWDEGYQVKLFNDNQKVKNYFPRMFNYEYLKNNQESFKDLLVKYKQVSNRTEGQQVIDDMLNQKFSPFESVGASGSSSGYFKSRIFDKIPDNELNPFTEQSAESVLRQYYTGASQAITRAQFFGRNVSDFSKRFFEGKNGIVQELKDSGMKEADISKVVNKVTDLYKKVTGLEYQGLTGKVANISSWGRLFQQMAHLPLATISSLSEPVILMQRAGLAESANSFRDMAGALGKNFIREIDRGIETIRRGFGGKSKRGIKDLDDDEWFEIYETGLALEQAVLDRLEGLTGDALTTGWSKKGQNIFFKLNLLDQWTRTVQLASFTTGKRAITRNSQRLYEHFSGIKKLSQAQRKYFEGQLNELGVNPTKARKWYENSLDDNFQFNINKAKEKIVDGKNNATQAEFYRESVLGGANRFVKEVILNPSTAEANRPLWFSSGYGQILMQFAGYPTVFTNTVLKRFAKDSGIADVFKGNFRRSGVVAPRTLGTAVTMTAVAVLGDYIRSRGKSVGEDNLSFSQLAKGKGLGEVSQQIKELGLNIKQKGPSGIFSPEAMEDSQIIYNAWRRWGGFGPLDYGSRFAKEINYNENLVTAIPKSFLGPLPQDVFDEIRYGSGPFGLAGRNLPGISSYDFLFGEGTSASIKEGARKLDEDLKDYLFEDGRSGFTSGGLVKGITDVPNTSEDPADRNNPYTDESYSGKSALEKQLEELNLPK